MYRLAEGLLERNVELEVFTAAASPKPLPGCAIHEMTADSSSRPASDALPVFQLGNNMTFHAFQPSLLARFGGLVHLHDPVLHHLHVDCASSIGGGGYWGDLEFWYGEAVADRCRRLMALGVEPRSTALVTAVPLFEPYLQFADAVLVHSQSALRTIAQRMPALRGYYLPQCYPRDPSTRGGPRQSGGPLRLGVFGVIEPHKRLDQILAAMAELRRRGIDIRLDICGEASAAMGGLVDHIGTLGLNSVVEVRGYLDHAAFMSAIAAADLCVNLRDPTMGETSAVVIQAMQLGTPVIVTDTGWYAELPDFVLKVPAGPEAVEALVTHLARLDADRALLSSLAESTGRYASVELDYAVVTDRYVEILSEIAGERSRRRMVEDALYREAATALADVELSGSRWDEAMAAEILGTLAPCF
jgi:glycosyltransferase involved in cell wall biosynthesis